jgi:DNA-binding CsgD family transcriptional regulator
MAELTPRQREVGRLLAEGLRPNAIADRLNVSPRTVRQHISDAADRLPGPGRPQHRLLVHALTQRHGRRNG